MALERMTPMRCTGRETGASLFKDRCVLTPPPFDHGLGDARLGDFKPELEQFAVVAWRAPKRIFDARPPDQHARLQRHFWGAASSAPQSMPWCFITGESHVENVERQSFDFGPP
jgi:hypothetical protein